MPLSEKKKFFNVVRCHFSIITLDYFTWCVDSSVCCGCNLILELSGHLFRFLLIIVTLNIPPLDYLSFRLISTISLSYRLISTISLDVLLYDIMSSFSFFVYLLCYLRSYVLTIVINYLAFYATSSNLRTGLL